MSRIHPNEPHPAEPDTGEQARLRQLVADAVQELANVPVDRHVTPFDISIAHFTAAAELNHRALGHVRSLARMLVLHGVDRGQLGAIVFPNDDPADDDAAELADRFDDWLDTLSALPIRERAQDGDTSETAQDRIWRRLLNRTVRDTTTNMQLADDKVLPSYVEEFAQALTLHHLLTTQLRHDACTARAADYPWAALADLLGLWTDQDDPGHATFSWLVPGDPTSIRSVVWRCSGPLGCGQEIDDASPVNGINAEHGHAPDCARRARDVAAEAVRADAYLKGQRT